MGSRLRASAAVSTRRGTMQAARPGSILPLLQVLPAHLHALWARSPTRSKMPDLRGTRTTPPHAPLHDSEDGPVQRVSEEDAARGSRTGIIAVVSERSEHRVRLCRSV